MKPSIAAAVICLLSLILPSCGETNDQNGPQIRAMRYQDLGPSPGVPASFVAESRTLRVATRELQTRQYIVTDVEMLCEVSTVDSSVRAIRERLAAVHGLVGRLSISTSADSQKSAQLLCLVPSAALNETLEWLPSQVHKVRSQSVSSHDESARFYDIEAHLRNKKAAEKRIRDILVVAKTATEIAAIEKTLAEMRSDIEELEGEKHDLIHKTEYAEVSLSLVPVPREVIAGGQTLWGQIAYGFKQGTSGFGDVLGFCIRVVIAGIPAIVLFGLIAWGVRSTVYRRTSRAKSLPLK